MEEEKSYPAIAKREVYEPRPEVSAFDGDDENANFNTHRDLISARGRYESENQYQQNFSKYADNEHPPVEIERRLESTEQERKKIKRKKEKKEKKNKSKKRKKSKNKDKAESQPIGLTRKATVIVSKRIVRQATERGQTLSEFVRENKLRLVAPSQNDLK